MNQREYGVLGRVTRVAWVALPCVVAMSCGRAEDVTLLSDDDVR